MTEQLKPCPFCNGEASISLGFINGNPNPLPYIECVDCAASTDLSENEVNAIKKWNTRAPKDCEHVFAKMHHRYDDHGNVVYDPNCVKCGINFEETK